LKQTPYGQGRRKLTQTLTYHAEGDPLRGEGERGPRGGSAHEGEASRSPEFVENDDGGGCEELGHGRRSGEIEEGKEKLLAKPPGRGLYAPAVGSRDALKVAPDASGDHRTHAQRGMQIGTAPDDGHRTLVLASGASGHAR